MNIAILNGRVVDPASGLDGPGEVYISAEKVVSMSRKPDGFVADQTIDATGLVVAPGLVDLCARLREPGNEFKNALASEMHAAVAGGITSLVCPPDTDPVLDEPGLVEMLRYRAKNLRGPRVFPAGALTIGLQGARLTEMAELKSHGCVAFSHADAPLIDTQVLYRALQYASTFSYPVILRAEDAHLAGDGVAHEGQIAARLGLSVIPTEAETIGLLRILELVRMTRARVHIARLSCARAIDLMRSAKQEGLPVTCDVAVHHAHMTELDIGFFDARCRVIPPFRAQADRAAIRQGLADGTIDAICSDHAPVDDDSKQLPFGEAEPGVTSVELLLPLTLKWAREEGIDLSRALALITSRAAAVFNLSGGKLTVGGNADLALFSADEYWKITAESLSSQGKNTPFIGYEVQGRMRHTLVAGALVTGTPPGDVRSGVSGVDGAARSAIPTVA